MATNSPAATAAPKPLERGYVAFRVTCSGCSRTIWEGSKPYNLYIAEVATAWRAHLLACPKFKPL